MDEEKDGHPHFDDAAEDEKLALVREKEQEDLAEVLSAKHGMEYTDLTVVPVNMEALRLILRKDAEEARAVAFDKNGKQVSLALANPDNPALARVVASLEDQGLTLTKFLVSERSIERALARYDDLSLAQVSAAGVFSVSAAEFAGIQAEAKDLAGLRAHLASLLDSRQAGGVSRLLEEILASAFALKASDIHIEPEETAVRMRFRVDGLLADAFDFDAKAYHSLLSRIKLLSGVKLNVANRAQDGRFTVAIGESEVEIRTSIIPGNYGESVVMRILDPSGIKRSLEDSGVNAKLLARLRKEIRRPNGMLLTTGPTGSGKTTTLYSFIKEIYSPDLKIVTIEDPVEYHLEGIVQTQTDGKDYTFASGLRSVLRQDPDVIMVGEIRDAEVAETAIQAALTGHFVFSTLHTNNAAGTFPRLIDLGVDPKLFASAVTVAMAQRLARTLDDATKRPRATTAEEKEMMARVFSTLEDKSLIPASFDTVYEAVPDEATGATGYKGRTGIHEAIFMDAELGEFLRDNPAESDIAKHALRQGYPTMAQDALIKVLAGKTTLEEVARTVDLLR